jgi:hypothetical protein
MNRLKHICVWSIGAFLAIVAYSGHAVAADPHSLDIHVSISGNKSLTVDNTYYNFGQLAVNVSSVTASSFTVTNNSGVFIETYTITGNDAIDDGGGVNWTLAASTGADTYALAAQFSDTRPSDTDGSWTSDSLNTGATTCNANELGNSTEGEAGSNVSPSGKRYLWFRIKTPSSVTNPGAHTATVVLAVL